jgi:hypothetical protein
LCRDRRVRHVTTRHNVTSPSQSHDRQRWQGGGGKKRKLKGAPENGDVVGKRKSRDEEASSYALPNAGQRRQESAKSTSAHKSGADINPRILRRKHDFTFAARNDAQINHGYPGPGTYSPASLAARRRISVGAPPVLQWILLCAPLHQRFPFPGALTRKPQGQDPLVEKGHLVN